MTEPEETEWHLLAPDGKNDPHEALKNWERLRIRYNAILVPFVLVATAMLRPRWFGDLEFWADAIAGGIASNVCFCLGPVFELYLVWLGANPNTARKWLFGLGTAFTALAAFAAILLYSFLDK
ncbi:MAG: hypothetical protein U0792_22985 [Gemmataceae bacterium]